MKQWKIVVLSAVRDQSRADDAVDCACLVVARMVAADSDRTDDIADFVTDEHALGMGAIRPDEMSLGAV